MQKNKFLLSLLLILNLSIHFSIAQENLAYTRYGIGELKSQTSAAQRGFGEIYSSYNSPSDLNTANPASLGFLKLTTFDFAGFSSASWIKTASENSSFQDVSLDYLTLGFPVVKNHWGMALGLSQFCKANYNISQLNETTESVGPSDNIFKGDGGFYQFYIANGVKIKNLALGIKLNYVFGTIRYSNSLEFIDTTNAYNTRKEEARTAGGLSWTGGVQYNASLNKKYQLCFGLDGNLKSNLNAKRNLSFERYKYDLNGLPKSKDTIYSISDEKGAILIPLQLNAGIVLNKLDKFLLGVQFHYGKWSDFRSFGVTDSTANNWKIAVGGEWTPDSKSIDNYFNRVQYRLGGYVGTNYLQFSGNNFNMYGVTIGAGFPVRHSTSLLNIAFDFGQLGNVKDNLLKQTYLRTTIGFSLNDIWFLKRKYD